MPIEQAEESLGVCQVEVLQLVDRAENLYWRVLANPLQKAEKEHDQNQVGQAVGADMFEGTLVSYRYVAPVLDEVDLELDQINQVC